MPEFYKNIVKNNREWVESCISQDPEYFRKLADRQQPPLLWIGCADSRVPANQIIGAEPGDVFVHRNIANMVVHSDMNMLSVLDYAVNVLKIKHVIVCGHYGCGGVEAALNNRTFGLIDNWLRHVQDVGAKHAPLLRACRDDAHRLQCLCELNVIEQVMNICHTSIARDAWERGQPLAVHGWIYGLKDGMLRDLDMTIAAPDEAREAYRAAVAGRG